ETEDDKKKANIAREGDLDAIKAKVDEYVLAYENLEKSTHLPAGRHWPQASPEQQQALVKAFMGTLIRTYSSAFKGVDKKTHLRLKPFRGDPEDDDVVVRSTLVQGNGQTVDVDYRMENTPEGWKIYDINAE